MRLKRLEIQGFKSFGQPVSLEFGPGITAIVGPNGSGKSNISDALRWVLGEQSIKKPAGQQDGRYHLCRIRREKAFGHGGSTVDPGQLGRISPAGLRRGDRGQAGLPLGRERVFHQQTELPTEDIQDLFTDTGLGRESYAVVGQGQIDQVLSVRSEDRRVLLEETAGIVKYRQRKDEALRKLEDTSVDLLRVTDVLHELEGQLGPLEEQAKQAPLSIPK